MWIDEAFTPDSSRFWSKEAYRPGSVPEPLDKQFVRDALDRTGWDRTPPAPRLAPEVLEETRRRYVEIYETLTGERWKMAGPAGGS